MHELELPKLFKSYNFSILHNAQGSQNLSQISGSH